MKIEDAEIRFLGDVQRLALKPGDILVLSAPSRISPDCARHLTEAVKRLVPGHEVLVLGDGLKVGVLEAA